ncbi:MAG: tRNA guanosine(34) transglycosylase Tgt [Deltaproteobacteria bacterium]|nr:tRNA guanosine(34) transglycosylase Tgt [Deltaproteobacteria bacterium]
MVKRFELHHQDEKTRARAGVYHTAHGSFETPAFMPVGTVAAVKALTPHQVKDLGAQIILSNTYHLYMRPGHKLIERLGGLHHYMGWEGPILTDSGGFQVFSLARLAKVSHDGVSFQSHLDGSKHLLTPELVIEIQESLGSDIMMPLDECLPYPMTEEQVQASVEITLAWEKRCLKAKKSQNNSLFAIIQGGMYKNWRQQCAQELLLMEGGDAFDGYAIGGVSVGEPMELAYEITDRMTEVLPKPKPRYLMGVGMPVDIITAIGLGIDMFDCVIPTRNARNGMLFTEHGPINIRNSQYHEDPKPISESCTCYTCQHFSKAYLRHISLSKEILSPVLNSIHNLHYYLSLLSDARQAIRENRFALFQQRFLSQQTLGSDRE